MTPPTSAPSQSPDRAPSPDLSTVPAWDRWFELTARRSTLGREVRGGIVTFVTMAYIVVLNPLIIGTAKDINGQYIGGGDNPLVAIGLVSAATALIAGVLTILMGAVGRFPLAVAAGLGINSFVAYTIAPLMTWPQAMGLIVIEGVIIGLLVITKFRTAVFNAVPEPLKYAIGVGIGLFIALIGFVDAGITRPGVPLISFGVNGALRGWPALVFVFGLLLMIVLVTKRVKGALLIGILATAALAIIIEAAFTVGPLNDGNPDTPDNPTGWALNVPVIPDQWFKMPDLSILGDFTLVGAFQAVGIVTAGLFVFSLLLTDFFDTIGTVTGLAHEAELTGEDDSIPHLEPILLVDSAAAAVGGMASVSSNTSYIESAAGIGEGARTGIASLVTGVLFLVAMFVAPLVSIVPYEAATPALVIVGFLMMTQIKHIPFDDYTIGIPAFLTIVVMPFTYSIANGIGAGMVTYVLLQVATGRARQVKPLMWVVAAAFAIYFAIDPVSRLLESITG
ncbi:MAG TPA: NCS2 family permease [Candidatus Nanopelagicales bacterium]